MDLSDFSFSPRLVASSSSLEGALVAGIQSGEFGAEEVPILIFRVGASLFGVPALAVREIVALPALSPLAETAPFVMGVFNLRGVFVPVVDLGARLGWDSLPLRLEDQLVVLGFDGAPVAILVSEVRVVSRVLASQMGAPPSHGRAGELDAPFVAGVVRTDEGMVMLLHLAHLLSGSSPSGRSAGRFDEHAWTEEERAVLEARAHRPVASEENSEGEAGQFQTRAPVAVVALGGEEFGVELRAVREFTSVRALTSVPCCPPHILGQISLRGDIITLIDARRALGTARTEPPFFAPQTGALPAPTASNARSVVVVSHPDGAVGIVVDDVRDVLYLRDSSDSKPDAPLHGFFAGSTLYQGRLLPLLDVARLLAEGGLEVEEHV